jgi:hypothetical protein
VRTRSPSTRSTSLPSGSRTRTSRASSSPGVSASIASISKLPRNSPASSRSNPSATTRRPGVIPRCSTRPAADATKKVTISNVTQPSRCQRERHAGLMLG